MLDIILKSIAVLVVDSQYFICDYLKWCVIVVCLKRTRTTATRTQPSLSTAVDYLVQNKRGDLNNHISVFLQF